MLAYTEAPPSYNSVLAWAWSSRSESPARSENDPASQATKVDEKKKKTCSSCEDEKRRSFEDLSKWVQFAKRTTLHGLKVYQFREGNGIWFQIRRAVLLCVVLLSFVLFTYHAISRVCYYTDYASNVDVQVFYTDSLEFPSVTLCNQNRYRITETVNRGMYDFIVNFYKSQNATRDSFVSSKDNNLTEFLLGTAHQKNDFIDSCTWKGERCVVDDDFTTTVTDSGVCYTFNKKTSKYVNQPGVGFALRLVLNIEQYEYITGLQEDVGIKVLLHAPREFPQVKDLGFSVPPGTHTLVAIHQVKSEDLEAPYGTCTKHSPPRSVCMSRLEAVHVSEKCGCKDVYMPDVGADVCNLTYGFSCAKSEIERISDIANSENECAVPCHRVTYSEELSYAKLSVLKVDQFKSYDITKFENLQEKYMKAREASEIVNKKIATQDRLLVQSIMEKKQAYLASLDRAFDFLSDNTKLIQRYSVTHDLSEQVVPFLYDLDLLRQDFERKRAAGARSPPYVDNFVLFSNQVTTFIEAPASSPQNQTTAKDATKTVIRQKLEDCAAIERKQATAAPSTGSQWDAYYSCKDTAITYYLGIRRLNLVTASRLNNSRSDVARLGTSFSNYAMYLFGNTTTDYWNLTNYNDCLSTMGQMTNLWTPRLNYMFSEINIYLLIANWTTKLNILGELEEFYHQTTMNDSLFSASQFEPCVWPYNRTTDNATIDRTFGLFLAYIQATNKSFSNLAGLRSPLSAESKRAAENFRIGFGRIETLLDQFLKSELTKKDLLMNLTSDLALSIYKSVDSTNDQFLQNYDMFITKISDLQASIYQAYQYLTQLPIPVLNDTNISRLNMTKYAHIYQRYYTNMTAAKVAGSQESASRAELNGLLQNLTVYREQAMLGLITFMYGSYRTAMQDIEANVRQSFDRLYTSIEDLHLDLAATAESNLLNGNFFLENFIKLDIFYKEMSFTKIQQQVVFDNFMLLSDIGGMMGLLLGASVLTACEMIDYLAFLAMARIRASAHRARGKMLLFETGDNI